MERKEDKGKCNNKDPVKSTMDMENTKTQPNPKSSHQRTAVAGVMFRSLSFINLILHLLSVYFLFRPYLMKLKMFIKTGRWKLSE